MIKVFISYSVDDRGIVQRIAAELQPHAEPVFWDQNKLLGEDAWRTIFGWIDAADCIIAVITDKVVGRGESVNQEIGYAKAKGKMVIPVVLCTVEKNRLGCLNGITYVEFDGENLPPTIDALNQRLAAMDQNKQRQQGLAILVVAVLVLLAISGGGK